MQGRRVQLGRRSELDDLTQVHDGDPVGDVANDTEVVRDEQVGEIELVLKLGEQIEYLGLNRDVEGRDGLVAHDQPWFQRESPGDPDALALATRELVWIAGCSALG